MDFLRVLLASIFFLCQALAPASAMLMINELNGFNVGSSAPALPSLTFLQCTEDTSNQTTYTYTSQNVGTASSTRATIVGVWARNNSTGFTINSATVDGNAATLVASVTASSTTKNAIFIISNTAGTSQTITVTASTGILASVICVWAAYDLSSLTAVASTVDNNATSAALTLNLSSTSADGIGVGICGINNISQTATWTGLTENTPEIGTEGLASSANLAPTTGGSLTVSCDWTGANPSSGVAASFR